MATDPILQFKQRIAPLKDAFDQLWLVCAAVRIEGKWVSIYTCLSLRNSADQAVFKPQNIHAGAGFVAFFVSYTPHLLDEIAREIESGCLCVNLEGERHEIYLTRSAAGLQSQTTSSLKYRFGNPWTPQRGWANGGIPFRPSIHIAANCDRFYELLIDDANERISRQLLAHLPPYNGLDGLLKYMGSTNRPNSAGNEALVEINAILPFDIKEQEDQVLVESPEALVPGLSVLYFFSPHQSEIAPYSADATVAGRSNWRCVHFRVPWPASSLQAEAHVRYNGEELERFQVRHWATGANWRLKADSYFDPDSRLLRQALSGDAPGIKEERRSEAFEQAVVRLLNVGGIPAIWHGSLRHSGRPDLVGYCEAPGRRIVLIGECTLEKPSAKLSPLRSRANRLREMIAESAEVVVVVFTACDPVEADYLEAAKANISLIGRHQIAQIEELVERNAGTKEILKQIENVVTAYDVPSALRWQPGYEY